MLWDDQIKLSQSDSPRPIFWEKKVIKHLLIFTCGDIKAGMQREITKAILQTIISDASSIINL